MNRGRLLVGVVLVVLGIVFLLDRLGVASADWLISGFWPLLIVAAGLLQIAVTRRLSLGPAITVLVGVILLAATLNLVPATFWQLFWPLVLIGIGVLLLDLPSETDALGRPTDWFVRRTPPTPARHPRSRSA